MMRERNSRAGADVLDVYEKVKSLGEGSMGSVIMVRKKHQNPSQLGSFKNSKEFTRSDTGSPEKRPSQSSGLYALKAIQLNRMSDEFISELKNEIDILKSLDHPNIVRPVEVFNRRRQMFVIMELCSGGDLYTRDPYIEASAAKICGKLCSAISYMHSRNITHRDLKFENIMFENNGPQAEIKVIDFGLSKKFMPSNPHLMEGVGTIYTMAPQVLQGLYTEKADLWSVGVIAFMLLCSEMPFSGRKRRHVIDKIMRCNYSFSSERWKNISRPAKEFVRNLIEMDPKKRYSADQALESTWLKKEFNIENRRPSVDMMEKVNSSLKSYSGKTKLQKMALMVVAHQSTTEEILELRKAFDQYDKSNNGTIQYSEFTEVLEGMKYPKEELDEIFASIDVDGSGNIHYTEFLAATLETHGHIEEERLAEAFDRLDSDDSGYITKGNLKEMLGTEYTKEKAEALIAEADINKDGRISWNEFKGMFVRQQMEAMRKVGLMRSMDEGEVEEGLLTVDA
eukprot:CAMPEP_0118651952 /NCGR_PEP_ID=MMETSP0785-20121206/11057_1 /TAXON_ID=91992 /ORGANISM="Bolidomonas pacifica, Strain CCMP 1866" /LENGTH=509 /DNA_ID=CAMNT_0006544433 /DNA_START=26 /DNA_END=1551 /DNA_ORIENTATION=+